MNVLGIDIGGSGIKGAVVDIDKGELITERLRLKTPQPATPAAVLERVEQLVRHFNWHGTIGCGFPAVIDCGQARTASNIDDAWIDFDVAAALTETTACSAVVINDADAAGMAEMRFGAGRGCHGTVLVLTLGTGIGSALFYEGRLFPNLELGLLSFRGEAIERYASAAVRREKKLSWEEWAVRLNHFLNRVESILTPERVIIGGGVSRKHDKFFHLLEMKADIVPADLQNQAGLVGAACFAADSWRARHSAS